MVEAVAVCDGDPKLMEGDPEFAVVDHVSVYVVDEEPIDNDPVVQRVLDIGETLVHVAAMPPLTLQTSVHVNT